MIAVAAGAGIIPSSVAYNGAILKYLWIFFKTNIDSSITLYKCRCLADHLGRPDQRQEPLVCSRHPFQLLEVLKLVLKWSFPLFGSFHQAPIIIVSLHHHRHHETVYCDSNCLLTPKWTSACACLWGHELGKGYILTSSQTQKMRYPTVKLPDCGKTCTLTKLQTAEPEKFKVKLAHNFGTARKKILHF